MNSLEKIKELNLQYKLLCKNGMVVNIELQTNVGVYSIRNQTAISKVLDLLIHESQTLLESEVDK